MNRYSFHVKGLHEWGKFVNSRSSMVAYCTNIDRMLLLREETNISVPYSSSFFDFVILHYIPV